MKVKRYFLMIVFVCYFAPLMSATAPFVIRLRADAEVAGNNVFIKNIAFVYTKDKTLKNEIDKLIIGHTPKAGLKRIFSKYDIIRALRKNNINHNEMILDGAKKTKVIRPSVVIGNEVIYKKACDFIFKEFSFDKDKILIDMKTNLQDLLLPKEKTNIKCELFSYRKKNNNIILNIKIIQKKKEVKSFRVSFFVKEYCLLPMAKHNISKGDKITKKDVIFNKMEASKYATNKISSLSEFTGKTAVCFIKQGKIITEKMVDYPNLIRVNDPVMINLSNGKLQITVQGKALSKGKKGELIKVKNLSSKRVIMAKVKDSNTVLVG